MAERPDRNEEASLVTHQANNLPSALDTRDPDFRRRCLKWAFKAQIEMMNLVLATENKIAISRSLMAETDRILARDSTF